MKTKVETFTSEVFFLNTYLIFLENFMWLSFRMLYIYIYTIDGKNYSHFKLAIDFSSKTLSIFLISYLAEGVFKFILAKIMKNFKPMII